MEENNSHEQFEEFQVLQSIYGDDIKLISPQGLSDDASVITQDCKLSFRLKIPSLIERQVITSKETDHVYHLFQTGVILEVECPSGYPTSDVPLLKIQSAIENVIVYCPPEMYEEHDEFKEMRRVAKEIQDKEIHNLTEILNHKARDSIGQVAMFILIQDVEDFLMEKSSKIKDFDAELMNKGNDIKEPKAKGSTKSKLGNIEHTILQYRKETKKGYYAFIDCFYSSLSFTKEFVEKKKGLERLMISSCNLNSKVYTWGGVHNGSLSNDMFEIVSESGNIIIKKIKQNTNCPPRLFHTFNGMQNGFVIIGGMTDPKTMSSSIHTGRMVGGAMEWQSAGKLAAPICGQASCVRSNLLYTFGGFAKSGFCNTFSYYEWNGGLTSFEKIDSIKCDVSARAGATMVELKGIIYIFGGHDEGKIFNDLYAYNIETNLWSKKTSQNGFIPQLTMANLLVRDSDSLVLYGGYDGSGWNSNMFEYNITENRWYIVPLVADKKFDNAATAGSIQKLTDSYVLLGGCANPSSTFNSYSSFLNRVLFEKKFNTTSEYSVRCLRSDKILKSEKTAVALQSETYFKWLEKTQPDDADVIFVFNPEEEESECLTENEKLPCCANKLILQRYPEFKKMIMIAEQKKQGLEVNPLNWDTYELNHGDLTYIRINYVPEVKYLKKAFIRVLQYIYSGIIDVNNLEAKHMEDIYQVAVYYNITLLVQSLLKEATLSSFLSHNFKALERELPAFLKFSPDGDVEDIEEFRSNMIDNPESIPDVKQGLVRILAPDHALNPPIYRSVFVHKTILCITSRYFAATFNSNFFEAQKRILIMDSISAQSLLVVLSFIYCPGCSLDLNASNAVEIYVLSHLLELSLLLDKARSAIKQFEFDEYTALHILEIANEFVDVMLQDYCLYLLARNYDDILKRDPTIFDELTPEQRVNIFKKHSVIKK